MRYLALCRRRGGDHVTIDLCFFKEKEVPYQASILTAHPTGEVTMAPSYGFLHSRRYKWINFYLPFLGAGIQVLHRQSDEFTIKMRMKLTRFNLNAVGAHFGGSLYAMCDPWFMLILMHHLGRE